MSHFQVFGSQPQIPFYEEPRDILLQFMLLWICYEVGFIGGAVNFCLQKSGMPMAGLVYLRIIF